MQRPQLQTQSVQSPEEHITQKIKDAEAAKATMFPITGKHVGLVNTAKIDEGYMVVGGHLDQSMVQKIAMGEYIDFGKLIPKD